MDCLRYFCSECVIKRLDKVFTCDSCGILSRRPLVRNQIRQMRSKDLRQYLMAKKVSIKGCVEKEDLVHLLMLFANGTDPCLTDCRQTFVQSTNSRLLNTTEEPLNLPSDRSGSTSNVNTENDLTHRDVQTHAEAVGSANIEIAEEITESDSSPVISVPLSTDDNNELPDEGPTRSSSNINIEEVFESDNSPIDVPEPVITEQDETPEASDEILEAPDEKQSDMITEIPTVCLSDKVELSDIKESSELEFLSVKQLKSLLTINRVDYKGCLERQELLNKVTRLWHEYKQSRKDVEKLSEEELCKICWDAPIECVILECGHMACCINCGKQMSECPICKQYVVRVVRFFKA